MLHVITVHLKSKHPSNIPGQVVSIPKRGDVWLAADGWAEGSFLSSMKRMSQALEVRRLIDQILDDDPDARIIVAGDFNAEPEEVPVLAICGNVEDTNNRDLASRVLVPIENTNPGPGPLHLLPPRPRPDDRPHARHPKLLAHYRGSEIHNEILHDHSIALPPTTSTPSPTTPLSSPPSTSTTDLVAVVSSV